jgi:hypothetical protein
VQDLGKRSKDKLRSFKRQFAQFCNLWTTIEITCSNIEEIIHVSKVNNFSECHNICKHTNSLEVEILMRNIFVSILEVSGRILTKECEKISFLHNVKKKFKTSCVLEDIIGTLGHQVVHVGGHKQNVGHLWFKVDFKKRVWPGFSGLRIGSSGRFLWKG